MFASFLIPTIACAAMQAYTEEKAFQDELATMQPEERQSAIKIRADFRAEQQRQRERAEMVEAMKPHTLWSFLGLGSK
ncbi:MAG: hypothetical protein WC710_14845 [Gallionella sp.]|jgi:hypothetical protein